MTRTPSTSIEPELGLVNSATLLELLYQKAEPCLTRPDLCRIAREGASYAERVAANAAEVAEGLGALIEADSAAVRNQSSGALQESYEQAELLWHFAEVLRSVQGAAHVASRAASLLNDGGAA